jgi:hypothetical protein
MKTNAAAHATRDQQAMAAGDLIEELLGWS